LIRRKTILLVDDSSTILMMEKFILRNDPYAVITASNGEEAVRKAAAEKPDLILLDVVMPRMSGFEACRLIRDNEELKHIPIIMVTTRGGRERRDRMGGRLHGLRDEADQRRRTAGQSAQPPRRPDGGRAVKNGRSYISHAREEQQQYISSLLRENEKLAARSRSSRNNIAQRQ
jgi:CheY-like chemotaxis protein